MDLDNNRVSAAFSFEGFEQAQLNVVRCSIPSSAESSETTSPNNASTTNLSFELECVFDEEAYQSLTMLYEMRVKIPHGTLTVKFHNNEGVQYTFGTFSDLVIERLRIDGKRNEELLSLSISSESFHMEYRNDFYEQINSR